MNCPHQSRTAECGAFTCALGLYGGGPYLRNCQQCIAAGENTPEFAIRLADRHATSHPANRAHISGCCDDARNYPAP